jgi:hypothetical protein
MHYLILFLLVDAIIIFCVLIRIGIGIGVGIGEGLVQGLDDVAARYREARDAAK